MKRPKKALRGVLAELLRSLRRHLPRLAKADVVPQRFGLVCVGHPGKDKHALVVAVLMDCRETGELPLGVGPVQGGAASDVVVERLVAGADVAA